MDENKKTRVLVRADEQAAISRAVIKWLNAYDKKPGKRVDFEYLGKTSGLTLSTVQAAYKTRQFITGGYQAQYQFQIVYRLIANNADDRISADEALNMMGQWAEENPPDLTDDETAIVDLAISDIAIAGSAKLARINRWKVTRDTGSSIVARYYNNAEDHAIQMTLLYEVILNG